MGREIGGMEMGRFCEITGNKKKQELLEAVYNVLDGRNGGENLLQLYRPEYGGIFVEGSVWEGVWTYNHFIGMTGWLPFLEPKLRRYSRNSIELWFKEQREDGLFPVFVSKEGKNGGYFVDEDTEGDEWIDGQLMGLMTICEHILFARDFEWGTNVLSKLRKAIEYILNRKFVDSLIEVRMNGVCFERCYGYTGYPSTSQIFCVRALKLMAEVEIFLNSGRNVNELLALAESIRESLMNKLFLPEGYFISAIDDKGKLHGKDDYFESHPNVMAAPLEIVKKKEAQSITKKIKAVPELDSNVPICSNYPARPVDEIRWTAGIGQHMNGGAWLGLGGFDVWTHLIAGEYERAEQLISLMVDMQCNHQLQDRVEYFGADKEAKSGTTGCDHPAKHAAGGFGIILRGLLGIQVDASGIKCKPLLFPDIKRLKTKIPVRIGEKSILLNIVNNSDNLSQVTSSDGTEFAIVDGQAKIDYVKLSDNTVIDIILS